MRAHCVDICGAEIRENLVLTFLADKEENAFSRNLTRPEKVKVLSVLIIIFMMMVLLMRMSSVDNGGCCELACDSTVAIGEGTV